MPDNKRLNAPDNTVPYHYYIERNLSSLKIKENLRDDGRNAKDHRKICNYFHELFKIHLKRFNFFL